MKLLSNVQVSFLCTCFCGVQSRACSSTITTKCCGDNVCDERENPQKCAADCTRDDNGGSNPGSGGANRAPTAVCSDRKQTGCSADIDYIGSGNKYQRMKLYLPSSGGNFSVVVNAAGSGWAGMELRKDAGWKYPCSDIVAQGIACATIAYRGVTSEDKFPTAQQDMYAAIRYLRGNSKTYNLNRVVGCTGHSSGSGLCSFVWAFQNGDTLVDGSKLQKIGSCQDESGTVQAAFLSATPVYVSPLSAPTTDCNLSEVDPPSGTRGSESGYSGGSSDTANNMVAVHYIDSTDVPVYIRHGRADDKVNVCNAYALEQAANHVSVNATAEYLKDQGHGVPSDQGQLVASYFKAQLSAVSAPAASSTCNSDVIISGSALLQPCLLLRVMVVAFFLSSKV